MSLTLAPRRRSVRAAAALVGAAALALTAAACSSSTASSGSSNFVGGNGEITHVAPADRTPAPNISGRMVDGSTTSLSAYKGKVVVINVWGSWCAPCRAEAPNLAEVAKADAAKGVQFLGLNTRDLDTAPPRQFEKRFHIPYPSFYDPSGNLIAEFPKGTLNPQSIPATLVIDREGRIAGRALKALTEDELHELLDPVVAEK